MPRRLIALALASLLAACAGAGSSESAPNGPPDEQDEQDVVGATRLASGLQDPTDLAMRGDALYFATNWGFATQQEAEYHHDVWVKAASGKAKRLYKGLYGGSWKVVPTKNGIYEINEGYASVMRLALDGSSKDGGKSIFHALVDENSEYPEPDMSALDADDDGVAIAQRTGKILAMSPAGERTIELGKTKDPHALKIAGSRVLVGNEAGELLAASRDGKGSLEKIATGEGPVKQIVERDGTIAFVCQGQSSKSGKVYVLPKGAKKAALVADGTSFSKIALDGTRVLYSDFGAEKIFARSIGPDGPIDAPKALFATPRPGDLLPTQAGLYVASWALGPEKPGPDGEGVSREYMGAVYRLKAQ